MSSLILSADIKPQNILLDTPAIRQMFEKAPPQAFAPRLPPLSPPNDFYRQSEQLSSGEEDLVHATDITVKLADFGTGTGSSSQFSRGISDTYTSWAASWSHKHLTEWIQPQMLRAPEVLLGAEWDFKADIWNVGLVVSFHNSFRVTKVTVC